MMDVTFYLLQSKYSQEIDTLKNRLFNISEDGEVSVQWLTFSYGYHGLFAIFTEIYIFLSCDIKNFDTLKNVDKKRWKVFLKNNGLVHYEVIK